MASKKSGATEGATEKSGSQEERKTIARIVFTDEQRRAISKAAGRDVKAAQIVQLTSEEAKRLAPGVISAAAIVMCW